MSEVAYWVAVCGLSFTVGYVLTRMQARRSWAAHRAEMDEIRRHDDRMREMRLRHEEEMRKLRRPHP